MRTPDEIELERRFFSYLSDGTRLLDKNIDRGNFEYRRIQFSLAGEVFTVQFPTHAPRGVDLGFYRLRAMRECVTLIEKHLKIT